MTNNTNASLSLIGELDLKIYGLPVREWQGRNWNRAGVADAAGTVFASTGWVLSSGLALAVVSNPGAALVEQGATGRRLLAAHAVGDADQGAIEALMASDDVSDDAIVALGLKPQSATELAGFYNFKLRKRETPFAVDLVEKGVLAAEKELFKSSYKGVTDLVTKYAWPVPAFAVTRFCASLKIAPNTVTTVSLVFVLLAMWFFWHGQWTLGILSGWLMTFLDTVDGKLARTTLTSSKWGDVYDHGIDLIHPPFWYWAWYVGIHATEPSVPVWMDAALIVIFAGYLLGRAIEGVFIRIHGFHIHVWERQDSFMRVITARRNPNMLIFMILCMFGAPAIGFGLVALWTIFCIVFHTVRMVQGGFRVAEPPHTSWMSR